MKRSAQALPDAAASPWPGFAVAAVAGAALGTVLGVDAVKPIVNGSGAGGPYNIQVGVPLWITLTVPVAVCVLVVLTGLASTLLAARQRVVRPTADGAAPSRTSDMGTVNRDTSASLLTVRERLISGLVHRRITARLRLTALYGGLFLVCGAALLAVTYTLVDHAPIHIVGERLTAPQNGAQRIADLHDLVVESGIALAIMAVISALLGWLVAGRVLAPLRTITAATREISDTNLHRRLAITGPRDELRELAETIDALLGRLESAFDAQRRFVANASHELRTPLTTMRAVLDVAIAKRDVPPQLTTVDANLRQGLDQADRLLESFLALSRAQHGELGSQVTLSLRRTDQRRACPPCGGDRDQADRAAHRPHPRACYRQRNAAGENGREPDRQRHPPQPAARQYRDRAATRRRAGAARGRERRAGA